MLRVIFNGRRKSGRFDLEAIEIAVRSAMHRAGSTGLSKLLRFPARLPISCAFRVLAAPRLTTWVYVPNRC